MQMINTVILEGRLVKEVDLHKTQTGKSVVRFRIAVDEGKDVTNFINVTAWNQSADFLAQYVHKGDLLSITGKLRTSSYDDNGTTRYTMDVNADRVNLLHSRKETPEKAQTVETPEDNNLPW